MNGKSFRFIRIWRGYKKIISINYLYKVLIFTKIYWIDYTIHTDPLKQPRSPRIPLLWCAYERSLKKRLIIMLLNEPLCHCESGNGSENGHKMCWRKDGSLLIKSLVGVRMVNARIGYRQRNTIKLKINKNTWLCGVADGRCCRLLTM